MSNAYAQVFRVYLRRPWTSLQFGMFTVIGLATVLSSVAEYRSHNGTAGSFSMSIIFLGMVLWLIFREQVVGIRRPLLPNYVGPQLLSFILFSSALVSLWVFVLSHFGDMAILSAAALVCGFFAYLGVLILTQSVVLILLFVAFNFGTVISFSSIVAGLQSPAVATAVLCGAMGTFALTVFGFFRLTEESRYYRSPAGSENVDLKPRMTGQGNHAWAGSEQGLRYWIQYGRTQRVGRDDTRWQRVRRWRCQNQRGLLLMAIWFCGISVLLPWYTFRKLPASAAVTPQPNFAIIFFAMMVSQQWLTRWAYLEGELLRPVGRASFFKQLGGAMAIDFVYAIAASIIAMAIPVFMFSPAYQAFQVMLPYAAEIAGAFVLLYGLTAWVLRYRSRGLLTLTALVVLPALLLPNFFDKPLHREELQVWIFLGAAGLSLLGAALSVHAYRLWMKAELG